MPLHRAVEAAFAGTSGILGDPLADTPERCSPIDVRIYCRNEQL